MILLENGLRLKEGYVKTRANTNFLAHLKMTYWQVEIYK